MDPSVLSRKPLTELKTIASALQMRGYQRLRKAELVDAIVAASNGERGHLPAGADVDAPAGSPVGDGPVTAGHPEP
ncbi:MAG: Rho termination factor N-terminal domain-containing protein, partial [Actinomycetota bacterium]|nr:Rho termination factor N-terminal domain-containing protein [Actinomycetota bacterium]